MIRWLLVLMLLALPAQAQLPLQEAAAGPEAAVAGPSPNDVRELSRLLADPAILGWLARQAENAGVEAAADEMSMTDGIDANLERIRERVAAVGAALAVLPDTPSVVAAIWRERLPAAQGLRVAILVLIFVFTGGGLEWLYWRYAGHARRRIEHRRARSYRDRALSAAARLALATGGAACFAVGTVGTFVALDWPPGVQELVVRFLVLMVGLRIAGVLGTFALSPHVEALRLVPLAGNDARIMFVGIMALTAVFLGGSGLAETSVLLGAAATHGLAVHIVAAAAVAVLGIVLLWALCRRTGNAAWAPAGTVVVLMLYLLWLVGAYRVAGTLAVVALFVPLAQITRRTVAHAFAHSDAEDIESRETRIGIYKPVAERLARFAVVIVAVVALAAVWGIRPWDPATIAPGPGRVIRVLIDITVAYLIGDLLWTATRTAIDRRMASMPKLTHGQAPGPEARMATLLPLIKKVVLVTVVVMVALIALSSLGINIGPLLAGAGVVGLAIGFGAQALVRDIVSGVFFLIDDAFRVGEYIEMGELRGTVESISVRSLRVRHHRGAVHTIPFGELKSLTNYSRDWVMMKLEFRVPFDTDLQRAKKIVKRIDEELRASPDYGHHFLEPLKFQGVRRMEEYNMVVGVKFMTKPGEQWTIRRDAYQRIRDEFEKAGINFAQRNVKVEVVGNRPVTEDVSQAALGAAQEAIERQVASKSA